MLEHRRRLHVLRAAPSLYDGSDLAAPGLRAVRLIDRLWLDRKRVRSEFVGLIFGNACRGIPLLVVPKPIPGFAVTSAVSLAHK